MNKVGHLVSVIMITYRHEEYLGQAIEGVLSQETNFPIELIISNDCSPDNSDDVIMWYINHHPKGYLLKYLNHEKNIGMHANFFSALDLCNGKYIAFCEGDDYWIDTNKLQAQYNSLEKDAEVGLVHTDYNIFYQKTGKMELSINSNKKIPTGSIYVELIKNNSIATLTSMVRKELCDEISLKLRELSKEMLMIDYPLWLYIAVDSKVAYINKPMACYRFLEDSASHSSDINKLIKFETSLYDIRIHFLNYIKNVPPNISRGVMTNYKYNKLAQLSMVQNNWSEFINTFRAFHSKNKILKHALGSFYYLFKKVFR